MRPRRSVLAAFVVALGLVSCAPANERPVRGAVPGSEPPTQASLPPTLSPSEALRLHTLAAPSPEVVPSPSSVASPSAVATPPIVRTIAPSAGGHVPAGSPVSLSAVLIGRGADLASATLFINGADAGAQIDKRTPRDWTIHASQTLGNGTYTARVLVRDATGAAGGFTWQFLVGDEGVGSEDLGSREDSSPSSSRTPQSPAKPGNP